MPLDSDQAHDPAYEEDADAQGGSTATPEHDAAPDESTAPAAPRRSHQRLASLYRQWVSPGRPVGEFLVLVRTTPDDPAGLPHLDLLGVEPPEIDDAWSAWDEAQLASDATPVGRALRPLLGLVPWGGRWTACRSFGGTCLLEPIGHPTPARAIRAAQVRFELVAARRIPALLDDLLGLDPDAADDLAAAATTDRSSGTDTDTDSARETEADVDEDAEAADGEPR